MRGGGNRSAVLVPVFQTSQMQPFVFQLVCCQCCEDYFRCGAAWGNLSFHRTTACRYNLATFSLQAFCLLETGVCSNSPFGSGACYFTGLWLKMIPRRRVWDERACMCVLAWLTRWECLALFLRPCPQSCVWVCCLISVFLSSTINMILNVFFSGLLDGLSLSTVDTHGVLRRNSSSVNNV